MPCAQTARRGSILRSINNKNRIRTSEIRTRLLLRDTKVRRGSGVRRCALPPRPGWNIGEQSGFRILTCFSPVSLPVGKVMIGRWI